jgi:hypothetical protein
VENLTLLVIQTGRSKATQMEKIIHYDQKQQLKDYKCIDKKSQIWQKCIRGLHKQLE